MTRLRAAIESGDFAAAAVALDEYVARFHERPKTLEEAAAAKEFLAAMLEAMRAARAGMAAEMAFLPSAAAAHTWSLDV